MDSLAVAPRRSRARILFPLLLLLLVASAGLLAYRFFFNRMGEKAIQLIPADALMVVTLDTNPSPAQVPVFLKIKQALRETGLNAQVDKLLSDTKKETSILREIRPYITDNFAFAMFGKPGSNKSADSNALFFVAMRDVVKAREALGKYGQKTTAGGLERFDFPKEKTYCALISGYLVLTDQPEMLARVEAVRAKQSESLAELKAYQEARAALPSDANVMVFLSPAAIDRMGEQVKAVSGGKVPGSAKSLKGMNWVAASATLRETGISFDFRSPLDVNANPALRQLGQITAIDPLTFKHLPAGAYGLMGMSQPGQCWNVMTNTLKADTRARHDIETAFVEFEKTVGLSVTQDIVPAFMGSSVLAVYPDMTNPNGVADILMLFTDANGADPAALAEKVRQWIERESGKEGKHPVHFASAKQGNATVWAIDAESEHQLKEAIAPTANGGNPSGTTAPHEAVLANTPVPNPSEPYLKGKTLVYAQVGKSVLLASSKPMLEKALAVYQGQGASLAEDAGYAIMQKSLTPGAQSLMLVHTGHIMQRLRPMLADALKQDTTGIVDDIIGVFGSSDAGLAVAGRYDGNVATGTLFLPLNYERLIHLIGKATKKSVGPDPARLSRL